MKRAAKAKAARFDVRPEPTGGHGFDLYSANGQLLAVSPPTQPYATRRGAHRGALAVIDAVESVQRANADVSAD